MDCLFGVRGTMLLHTLVLHVIIFHQALESCLVYSEPIAAAPKTAQEMSRFARLKRSAGPRWLVRKAAAINF